MLNWKTSMVVQNFIQIRLHNYELSCSQHIRRPRLNE